MQVTFWGSRGSSPVVTNHAKQLAWLETVVSRAQSLQLKTMDELLAAAREGRLGTPLSFGGHTPCTEVSHNDQRYFVDMGTGLREAGTKYMGKQKDYVFFLTHMHWDHLQGLLFFVPIFVPGHKVTIYHVHKTAPEYVRILFNGVNFPVKWDQLGAQIEFKELKLYEKVTYGDVAITPFALDHPGGSFGYRFEAGGKTAVIGVDGEYTRVTREDLGKDLPFYQNLDLLVFDAQYELDELLHKHDWGHSSASIGIDLALREGIKNLVLIHHDPWASDERLVRSLEHGLQYVKMNLRRYPEHWRGNNEGPRLISAYDGLVVDV